MAYGVGVSNGHEYAIKDLCDETLINDETLEMDLKLNKLQCLKFRRAANQYKQENEIKPFPTITESLNNTQANNNGDVSGGGGGGGNGVKVNANVTVDCVVPPGLSEGMNFHLDIGNGRRVSVKVPMGVIGGQVIRVSLPSPPSSAMPSSSSSQASGGGTGGLGSSFDEAALDAELEAEVAIYFFTFFANIYIYMQACLFVFNHPILNTSLSFFYIYIFIFY